MRICLMIEGQEGVAWADWVALAQACERLGFDALFRSDHYLSVDGQGERGSLDAWGTVSALARDHDGCGSGRSSRRRPSGIRACSRRRS